MSTYVMASIKKKPRRNTLILEDPLLAYFAQMLYTPLILRHTHDETIEISPDTHNSHISGIDNLSGMLEIFPGSWNRVAGFTIDPLTDRLLIPTTQREAFSFRRLYGYRPPLVYLIPDGISINPTCCKQGLLT